MQQSRTIATRAPVMPLLSSRRCASLASQKASVHCAVDTA